MAARSYRTERQDGLVFDEARMDYRTPCVSVALKHCFDFLRHADSATPIPERSKLTGTASRLPVSCALRRKSVDPPLFQSFDHNAIATLDKEFYKGRGSLENGSTHEVPAHAGGEFKVLRETRVTKLSLEARQMQDTECLQFLIDRSFQGFEIVL